MSARSCAHLHLSLCQYYLAVSTLLVSWGDRSGSVRITQGKPKLVWLLITKVNSCGVLSGHYIPEEKSTAGRWPHAAPQLHFLECPWPPQVPWDPWPVGVDWRGLNTMSKTYQLIHKTHSISVRNKNPLSTLEMVQPGYSAPRCGSLTELTVWTT